MCLIHEYMLWILWYVLMCIVYMWRVAKAQCVCKMTQESAGLPTLRSLTGRAELIILTQIVGFGQNLKSKFGFKRKHKEQHPSPNLGDWSSLPPAQKRRRNDTHCLFFQHLRGLLLCWPLSHRHCQITFLGGLGFFSKIGVNWPLVSILLGIDLLADVEVLGGNRAHHQVENSTNRDQPSLGWSYESGGVL